jgi:hypothetical protein
VLTWSPIQRVPETPSPGIKRLGREAGQSPPSSAEVCLHDRNKYTFHIFLQQPPSCTKPTARSPPDPPPQHPNPPYCVFPLLLSSRLANLFTAILLMLSTHENIFGLESIGAGASKAFRCYFFLLCSVWLELCTDLLLGFYTLNA